MRVETISSVPSDVVHLTLKTSINCILVERLVKKKKKKNRFIYKYYVHKSRYFGSVICNCVLLRLRNIGFVFV